MRILAALLVVAAVAAAQEGLDAAKQSVVGVQGRRQMSFRGRNVNMLSRAVGVVSDPSDPRYRQSYLDRIGDLLANVEPVSINFGSILGERTSVKRLFTDKILLDVPILATGQRMHVLIALPARTVADFKVFLGFLQITAGVSTNA